LTSGITSGTSGSMRCDRALLQTAMPALAISVSRDVATSAGSAEKTRSQSFRLSTVVGVTTISLTLSGYGASRRQLTTFPYGFPALRSEAVRASR